MESPVAGAIDACSTSRRFDEIARLSQRPKLLFLCQTLPHPPDGGVWIRTYHVLRLLSRDFDTTALCFERTDDSARRDPEALERGRRALGEFAEVEVFSIPQAHSRVRRLWDHARSLIRRRVYTHYLYESPRFRARLEELLRSRDFSLVHFDSLDLVAYLPLCSELLRVCVHHNVESALLRRRAEIEGPRLSRAYLRLQAELQEREERRWAPLVDLNVMVSEEDSELLERIAPRSARCVTPNGVDVDEFRPGEGRDDGIVFVGGTSWFPNLDALTYFCEEILPHLREADTAFPIRWVGAASDAQKQFFGARYGVELTGYVKDVRPHIRDSFCHIVPLRAGGGTRLKILNAWAMGRPVVSTRVGCEGLEAIDDENVLIRDDPRAFAGAILDLAGDAALRQRLGSAGRRTAERVYGWEVIGEGMRADYHRLLGEET
jgi:glycosyltransferase involved in cell wall biosynthesis